MEGASYERETLKKFSLLLTILLLWPLPAFSQAAPLFVRIGLVEHAGRVSFGCSVPARVLDSRGKEVCRVAPLECWQIEDKRGKATLFDPKKKLFTAAFPLTLKPVISSQGIPLIFLAGKWYRGEGEFRPGLLVINRLPIDEYLYGVVPSEMPASWPIESLKAQAIAARTYAIANLGLFARQGFDLRPTIDNQVYGGAQNERIPSNQAVDSTRGEVVTYNGRVIRAYYHSCAGGYTESSETVWGKAIPYLQAVPDFDQEAPRYLWQKTFSKEALSSLLGMGSVREILPLQRGYSGRISHLKVVGSTEKTMTGEQFRKATGLFSTLFNVQSDLNAFTFSGRGFGHGLGLSQWGAKALGEKGYLYPQILRHYYPTASLDRLAAPGS
ncbi:MAG TPA: sporulation protein [Cyanobacteria bacterium UBA8530]|nr:sporulation protein [Cyanobacteria bacterium UBA8530]